MCQNYTENLNCAGRTMLSQASMLPRSYSQSPILLYHMTPNALSGASADLSREETQGYYLPPESHSGDHPSGCLDDRVLPIGNERAKIAFSLPNIHWLLCCRENVKTNMILALGGSRNR